MKIEYTPSDPPKWHLIDVTEAEIEVLWHWSRDHAGWSTDGPTERAQNLMEFQIDTAYMRLCDRYNEVFHQYKQDNEEQTNLTQRSRE